MAAVQRSVIQPVVFGSKKHRNEPGLGFLHQLAGERFDVPAQGASCMRNCRGADHVLDIGERLIKSGVDADGGDHIFGMVSDACQFLRVIGSRVDQAGAARTPCS